jgi:hypothetical protein
MWHPFNKMGHLQLLKNRQISIFLQTQTIKISIKIRFTVHQHYLVWHTASPVWACSVLLYKQTIHQGAIWRWWKIRWGPLTCLHQYYEVLQQHVQRKWIHLSLANSFIQLTWKILGLYLGRFRVKQHGSWFQFKFAWNSLKFSYNALLSTRDFGKLMWTGRTCAECCVHFSLDVHIGQGQG